MKKNTAGQHWRVKARWASGAPYLGGAATITAVIDIDGAGAAATNDVNPTEATEGEYDFTLAQAETNGYTLTLTPSCSVAGVIVTAEPPAQYTSELIDTVLTRVPQVIAMAQIGGTGAWYVEALDNSGAAVAPAATALSNATWTGTKAGYLDAAISGRQATVANLADAVTMAAQFATMIVLDGAVYQFTANAMELGAGGSSVVNITTETTIIESE